MTYQPMIPMRLDTTLRGIQINKSISTLNEFNSIHNAYESNVAADRFLTGFAVASIALGIANAICQYYLIKEAFKDMKWEEEEDKNKSEYQKTFEAILKARTLP